jgi:cellulose synthase/poly-beta-1,6-N-acetylglucosamine synthase-like glycosyltransferase
MIINILVCTLNEEKNISKRLHNLLELSLPQNLAVTIHIIDNGSIDSTCSNANKVSISSNYPIYVHKLPAIGKCAALFWAFENLKADIYLMTDANTVFSSDALVEILNSITKTGRVGVLVGNSRSVQSSDLQELIEKNNWHLQVRVLLEKSLGFFSGANGAFYAVTWEAVDGIWKLPPIRNDDFAISVYAAAYGSVRYIKNAIAYEVEDLSLPQIYKQKYRDALGHFQAICWILSYCQKNQLYSYMVVFFRISYWFLPSLLFMYSFYFFGFLQAINLFVFLQFSPRFRRLTTRVFALTHGFIVGIFRTPPVSWNTIR